MVIILAFVCEALRYIVRKEFFLRNISVATIGVIIGCFIHPNYPNNYISIFLNAILVPFYTITGSGLDFGGEFNTLDTKSTFIDNFAVFFFLNIVLWMKFLTKIKLKFSTIVWWGCSCIYLLLAFLGNRYWYTANALFFIFFASFLRDWKGEREWKSIFIKINSFVVVSVIIFSILLSFKLKKFTEAVSTRAMHNIHYENVSLWMKQYVPRGETIFHAYWSDSPFFMCLNPKNNYLVVLDPVYMFYRYPKEYMVYTDLRKGRISNPQDILKKMFGANYGYTRSNCLLYDQIKSDAYNFKIIYEDDWGVFFKILDT